jgi:hypothetical protein
LNRFVRAIKELGLAQFYLALDPEEKTFLAHYSRNLWWDDEDGPGEGCAAESAARFLWVTAANAIPLGEYAFAEKLLLEALNLGPSEEDRARIRANLAQVCFDQTDMIEGAAEKGVDYCRQLVESGYFASWALSQMQAHAPNR